MNFLDNVALNVARLGPAGLSPKAPGTAGSAVAALAAPWLFLPLSPGVRGVMLLVIFFVGALAATRAEQLLDRKDPSSVVVDELVGQWITLSPLAFSFAAPALSVTPGPVLGGFPVVWLVTGFALFRLFDIWKPGLIHASENWLPDGYGVMIDDVMAGLFAMLIMLGLLVFLPPLLG